MNNYQILINSKKDLHIFIDKLINKIHIPFCICLIGPLGVGKTYFSKYLINKLSDSKVNVSSPTFSLVNIYDVYKKSSKKTMQIWHYDLYRITNEEEVLNLGFEESLRDNIVIIEWADRLHTLFPHNSITVKLDFIENNKRLLETNYVPS